MNHRKSNFSYFTLTAQTWLLGLFELLRESRDGETPQLMSTVYSFDILLSTDLDFFIFFSILLHIPQEKKPNPGPASLFRKTLGKMTQLLRWPSSTCHCHHPSVRHPWCSGFWSLTILYFIASSVTILSLKV